VEHYKQCPYEKNLRRVLDENSLDILIKQTPQKIIPQKPRHWSIGICQYDIYKK
jgi:hypothetical protein